MTARYALYFAPGPGSRLAVAANAWLGRDALQDRDVPRTPPPFLTPERYREITRSPRHYGFHATLKPPFTLAKGRSLTELQDAVAGFVERRSAVTLPALDVAKIGTFLALVPRRDSPEVIALAADAVRGFDVFRGPQSPTEVERRRRNGLTPRQEELLATWGYPYVLEQFRFHMTLTGHVESASERQRILSHLRSTFEELLAEELIVDAISIFEQDTEDAAFKELSRFSFATAH